MVEANKLVECKNMLTSKWSKTQTFECNLRVFQVTLYFLYAVKNKDLVVMF